MSVQEDKAYLLNKWAKEINQQLDNPSYHQKVSKVNNKIGDFMAKVYNLEGGFNFDQTESVLLKNMESVLKSIAQNEIQLSSIIKNLDNRVRAIESQLAVLENSKFGPEDRERFKQVLKMELMDAVKEHIDDKHERIDHEYGMKFANLQKEILELQNKFRKLGEGDFPSEETVRQFERNIADITKRLDISVPMEITAYGGADFQLSEATISEAELNKLKSQMNLQKNTLELGKQIDNLQKMYGEFRANNEEGKVHDLRLQIDNLTQQLMHEIGSSKQEQKDLFENIIGGDNSKFEELQRLYQEFKSAEERGEIGKLDKLVEQIKIVTQELSESVKTTGYSQPELTETMTVDFEDIKQKLSNLEETANISEEVKMQLENLQKMYREFMEDEDEGDVGKLDELREKINALTMILSENIKVLNRQTKLTETITEEFSELKNKIGEVIEDPDDELDLYKVINIIKGHIADNLLSRINVISMDQINKYLSELDNLIEEIVNNKLSREELEKKVQNIDVGMPQDQKNMTDLVTATLIEEIRKMVEDPSYESLLLK